MFGTISSQGAALLIWMFFIQESILRILITFIPVKLFHIQVYKRTTAPVDTCCKLNSSIVGLGSKC